MKRELHRATVSLFKLKTTFISCVVLGRMIFSGSHSKIDWCDRGYKLTLSFRVSLVNFKNPINGVR